MASAPSLLQTSQHIAIHIDSQSNAATSDEEHRLKKGRGTDSLRSLKELHPRRNNLNKMSDPALSQSDPIMDDAAIDQSFTRFAVPVSHDFDNLHVKRYLRSRHEPELEDYFFSRHARLRWSWDSFWFKLRSFVSITFTIQTLLMTAFSVGATILFFFFNVYTDLPLTLISVCLVFPISFGIGNNFARRENCLREVAALRALSMCIYMGSRDWPSSTPQTSLAIRNLRDSLHLLLLCMRQTMLHNSPPGGSLQVYKGFEDLEARFCDLNQADPAFRNSSMYSRLQQYLRQMIESFERLRVVHDYRTPSSLRAYALVWLSLSSILLAPLFAKYSKDYGLFSGVYCAIFISVIFSGLYRIFYNEEDPFDGTGVDDLSLEPLSRVTMYMEEKPHHRKRGAVLTRRRTQVAEEKFRTQRLLPQHLTQLTEAPPKLASKTQSAPYLYFEEEDESEDQPKSI